ncbi:MAG: helix-turn-helix transcriptional regulator [Leadbetterella sp.]|nr:helix-turn-helix transcriptional regulator [Leadbetterella sp.]
MTNKEKFLKLVSPTESNTILKNRERISNRAMLRENQSIALKVLAKLDELNWSQKKLAKALNVSPQQVSKIVSGKENSTVKTLTKLEEVLGVVIFSTKIEKLIEEVVEFFKASKTIKVKERKNHEPIEDFDFSIDSNPISKMDYQKVTPSFYNHQHFG